jgi:hypothetical protein
MSTAAATLRCAESQGASESAQCLAALVPALPEATARNLRILLSQSIALPSGPELRQARLGLLIELVSETTGVLPATERYDHVREQREAEAGEGWPHSTTLIRTYGHWTAAVAAAMALAHRPSANVKARRAEPHKQPPYTRAEVLEGIARCKDGLGFWPSAWELREYGRLCRHQARLAGAPDPRIPDRQTVLKHFGSWDHALAAARRAAAAR